MGQQWRRIPHPWRLATLTSVVFLVGGVGSTWLLRWLAHRPIDDADLLYPLVSAVAIFLVVGVLGTRQARRRQQDRDRPARLP